MGVIAKVATNDLGINCGDFHPIMWLHPMVIHVPKTVSSIRSPLHLLNIRWPSMLALALPKTHHPTTSLPHFFGAPEALALELCEKGALRSREWNDGYETEVCGNWVRAKGPKRTPGVKIIQQTGFEII